jgi:hypothetical protein
LVNVSFLAGSPCPCLAVSVVECSRWLVLLYWYEAKVSLPVLSRAVDRALVILG